MVDSPDSWQASPGGQGFPKGADTRPLTEDEIAQVQLREIPNEEIADAIDSFDEMTPEEIERLDTEAKTQRQAQNIEAEKLKTAGRIISDIASSPKTGTDG